MTWKTLPDMEPPTGDWTQVSTDAIAGAKLSVLNRATVTYRVASTKPDSLDATGSRIGRACPERSATIKSDISGQMLWVRSFGRTIASLTVTVQAFGSGSPPEGFVFVTTNSNADFVTSGDDRVIARAA